MKIIHTADIHLGSNMKTNMSAEKAKLRKDELLDTFKRMVEYAKNNEVKAIIIAGDLFDEGKTPIKVSKEVKEIITQFSDIDFIYLAGNHDKNTEFIDKDAPKNLKIFGNEWTTYSYDEIKITGIFTEANFGVNYYDKLSLDEKDFNIVVMHGEITKYDTAQNKEAVYLNKLKDKNIDYLALGHIHSHYEEPQKLDSRGVYNYSGCLEGRGFDEDGKKGFILLDIENKKIKSNNFIPFARREIVVRQVNITGCDSYLKIESAISEKFSGVAKDNIIKVILIGEYVGGTVKEIERLRVKFNSEYFYCKIEDNSKLNISISDYKNDISLKGEFIRLAYSYLAEDERDSVINFGLKALNGEEIDL